MIGKWLYLTFALGLVVGALAIVGVGAYLERRVLR
jgi:hypothetical protein